MKHISIIGFMGAGKTTIGRSLAGCLRLPFFDLDGLISERSGLTIPEIFSRLGEPEFRRLESLETGFTLNSPDRCVLATGGGTLLLPENRELLKTRSHAVFINPPFEVLLGRIGRGNNTRPLIIGQSNEALEALWRERLPRYQEVASLTLPSSGTPHELIREILLNLSNP